MKVHTPKAKPVSSEPNVDKLCPINNTKKIFPCLVENREGWEGEEGGEGDEEEEEEGGEEGGDGEDIHHAIGRGVKFFFSL